MAPTDAASAPNRMDRRRTRTRQAIIDVAIELFAEHGIRSVTIEEICDRADIAERTFFNHFTTREHLYEAIAGRRIDGLTALITLVTEDPRPIDERLRGLFDTIARGIVAQPAYRELLGAMLSAHPSGDSPLARNTAVSAATLSLIETSIDRGEISPTARPAVLADLLLGAVFMAIANWSSDVDFDVEAELRDSADALVNLLR